MCLFFHASSGTGSYKTRSVPFFLLFFSVPPLHQPASLVPSNRRPNPPPPPPQPSHPSATLCCRVRGIRFSSLSLGCWHSCPLKASPLPVLPTAVFWVGAEGGGLPEDCSHCQSATMQLWRSGQANIYCLCFLYWLKYLSHTKKSVNCTGEALKKKSWTLLTGFQYQANLIL